MSQSSDAPVQAVKNGNIHADMRVTEILAILPEAEPVLAQYGLSCFGCSASAFETLEEGCRSHGMKDDAIADLVTDLNHLLATRPERPKTIAISKDAAIALKHILTQEGKYGWVLHVALDENGGFCMEFAEKYEKDDAVFSNTEVPDVRVSASALTLSRIGGATIDLRDGRFKLDLPEERSGCACATGGKCDC